MKTIIGAVAVYVTFVMTGAPSAFAETGAPLSMHPQADYQSGFKHGAMDGKDSCTDKCH